MADKERGGARLSLLLVLALVAGLAVFGALPGEASFPGTNGSIAFTRGGDIFTVNPFTLGETRITFSGNVSNPNFNTNSSKLVVEILGGPLATLDPIAGAAPLGIPGTNAADDDPAFFPNGTKVAFDSTGVGGLEDIFTVDTNGANRTNLTNTGGVDEEDADVSADGNFIVYENQATGHIERITSTGGGRFQITPATACEPVPDDCDDPSVFPNLTRVAYDKDDGGIAGGAPQGIYSTLADGSSAAGFQLTNQNDDDPAVSPDNTRVVFDSPGASLFSTDTNGSLARTQASNGVGNDDDPTWGAQAVVGPSPSPGASPTPSGPGTQAGTVTRTKGGASRKTVQICDVPVAPTPALPAGTPSCIVVAKKAGSYSRTLPAGTYTKTAETGRAKRDGTFRVKAACTLSPASPVTITGGATTTVNAVCPK